MNITEDFINQFTGNPSTVKNGRSLAAKNSYETLYISEDKTLLFGSCKGSGKTPYHCSVDFSDAVKPIPRCSCPSRQIPCKHTVGLLYCYLDDKTFTTQAIPEDITSKRDKIQKRAEKKEQQETAEPKPTIMTKAKATAAIKKCRAQLEGIALAEKILHNIVLSGIHSMDKQNQTLYAGQVKELGNYYINGIQAAFTDLLNEALQAQKEQQFTSTIEKINYLSALLKKSKSYSEQKISDYEAFPATPDTAAEAMLKSPIEEQMGYAWKLTELNEKGLFAENEQLLQIAFDCIDDPAKKQFADEGVWVSLTSGNIYKTYNYRPYRSQKYIREEDSFFPVLTTPWLSIYPGEPNPRVRWDKSSHRDWTPEDLQAIQNFAKTDYSSIIKAVKNQIKSPLADKNPIYALKVHEIRIDEGDNYTLYDNNQNTIALVLEQFSFLLKRLSQKQVAHSTLICRFQADLDDDLLSAIPLALVNDETIIRFTY